MTRIHLLRRALPVLAAVLLLPLGAALADFNSGSWYTEGTFKANHAGVRVKQPTWLYVAFSEGPAFSLEDPDGFLYTGSLEVLGTKGTTAKGVLDESTRSDVAVRVQGDLASATGEAWTAIGAEGAVKARFTRQGTRLSVKASLVVTAVRQSTGKAYRVKERVTTLGFAE